MNRGSVEMKLCNKIWLKCYLVLGLVFTLLNYAGAETTVTGTCPNVTGCTAKEMGIVPNGVSAPSAPTCCVMGRTVPVTVQFNLFSNTTRYDVGVTTAESATSTQCTTTVYSTTDGGVFSDEESGNDLCGDITSSISGNDSDTTAFDIEFPTSVACSGSHLETEIEVTSTLFWNQNAQPPHCVASTAGPGTSSKCRTETYTLNITTIDAEMTLDKSVTIPDDLTDNDSDGKVSAGDILTYHFTIENTGQVGIDNVVVVDNKIPTVTCNDSTLAVGASTTCVGNYTVTAADVTAKEIVNNANAEGEVEGGFTVGVCAGETVSVQSNTDNTTSDLTKGSITVIKDANPNDATDFTFTPSANLDSGTTFTLDDDSDATNSNTKVFRELTPVVTYTVTEGDPGTDWSLTDISCSGSTSSVITTNLVSRQLSIDLAEGENIVCTFTNTKNGSLTIIKDAVPNNAQDFTFTGTGTGISGFTLDDDADGTNSNTQTFSNLSIGSYSITEGSTSGWDLSDLSCTGDTSSTITYTGASGGTNGFESGDNTVNLTLAAGEDITCTFENTKLGSLTIVKDAVPDDAQDFTFTGTGTGISGFTLDDDADGTNSNTQTFNNLSAGSYSITEGNTSGWDLSNLSCTGDTSSTITYTGASGGTNNFESGDDTVNITLAAGEDITCTFENTKQGSLTIIKDAVPDDAQDFSFTGTGTGISGFTLDDDANGTNSNTQIFSNLSIGSYSITEGSTSGWDLSNLSCTGNTSSTITYTGASGGTNNFESGDDTVNITLAAGEDITCTFENTKQGSLTIIKDAVPNDAQDFSFTGTGTGISGFTLDDDADGTNSNTQTFSNLSTGSYSITEGSTSGWDLSNLSCTGATSSTITYTGASGGTNNFESGDDTVNITLAAGEDITCTFENTKQGSLTIIKDAVPNDAQDFSFTGTGTGISGFTLDDDAEGTNSNTHTFSNLSTGSYSITEGSTSGWDLSNLSCTGATSSTITYTGASGGTNNFESGDDTVNITLAAGEDITCTFENTKQGSLTIIKDAVPNDAQDFSFTGTGTGISGFTLDDDSDVTNSNTQTFSNLSTGSYSITEGSTSGWDLSNLSCTGATSSTITYTGASGGTNNFESGDDTVNITLAAGEDITCTFENTKQGSLTIIKDAVPNDAQDFSFTGTGTGISGFTLDDDAEGTNSNTHTFSNLSTGSYSITEGSTSGWDLSNLSCTGATSSTITYTGASGGTNNFESGDDTVNITLAAGEDITCTFENTKQGSLTIVKDAVPNNAQDFSFTGTGTGISGFTLDDDAEGTNSNTHTFSNLSTGSYSITEGSTSGWDLSNLSCTGATSSTITYTGASGGTNNFESGDDTVNITLAAGEDITCTFENTKQGSLTIIKDAVPNDAQDFSFTGTGTGISGFTLDDDAEGTNSNTHTFSNLSTGSYSITEGSTSGWDLSNLSCTGATSSTITYTGASGGTNNFESGDDTVNITLAAGEDITCTFENTKQGSLTIIKDAVPNDAQDFSFTGTGTGISGFTLDDDAEGTNSNTHIFSNLSTGSYSITEGSTSGWDLSNLSCTGATSSTITYTGASGGTNNFESGDDTVNITLAAGEDITCTFTNKKEVVITLAKTWVDANLNDKVTITTTGGTNNGNFSPIANTASETDTAGSTFTVFAGETLTFNETFDIGSSSNYTATLACTGATDTDPSDGLLIDASDTAITCTYTNSRKSAAITLEKTWVNANIGNAVNVTADGTNDGSDDITHGSTANTANDTDTDTDTLTVFAGDTAKLTETFTSGSAGDYNIGLACSGNNGALTYTSGALTGTLVVDPNDTAITCTFTNSNLSSDYGDAPDAYGDASHIVPATPTVYLGSTVPDSESDTQLGGDAGVGADGDDTDGTDDEDAFADLPTLATSDTSYTLDVICAGTGTVAGWIDFDGTNGFEADERASATCSSGTATLEWSSTNSNFPASLSAGTTYARFRTASTATEVDNPTGTASDGEVEDYELNIIDLASHTCNVNSTFNAWDGGVPVNETLVATSTNALGVVATWTNTNASSFASGRPVWTELSGPKLRVTRGGGSATTTVSFDSSVTGQLFRVFDLLDIETTRITGYLGGISGTPVYPSFTSLENGVVVSGTNSNEIYDGDGSNQAGAQFTFGSAIDTVVIEAIGTQDYVVVEHIGCETDYGDAPDTSNGTGTGDYQTLKANGGPSHLIDSGIYIGPTVPDSDTDGFVEGTDDTGNASDDDAASTPGNGADEGGISFSPLSTTSTSYTLSNVPVVNSTGKTAYLVGWIDFNGNGDFTDTGEQSNVAVVPNGGASTVNLSWLNLSGLVAGDTYARFRISTDSSLNLSPSPIGSLPDGEVEDYQLTISTETSLGVAKTVGNVTDNLDGSYNVAFTITLENLGDTVLTALQVNDDLKQTFPNPASYTITTAPTVINGPLDVNSSFNGDTDINLLATSGANNTLAVGENKSLGFVIRVIPDDPTKTYYNQACAEANGNPTSAGDPSSTCSSGDTGAVVDASHNGTDPDPDGNNIANETGNNDPTPIQFTSQPELGVAKAASNLTAQGNGTFNVTYTLTLENMGNVAIDNLQINDDLVAVFGAVDCSSPTTSYCVVGGSIFSNDFTINPAFNGDPNGTTPSDDELLFGNSNSLNIGESGSLEFKVNFNPNGQTEFCNSATGFIDSINPSDDSLDAGEISDISTDGSNPDSNGDGSPSEQEPTCITIPSTEEIGLAKAARSISNNQGTNTDPVYQVLFEMYVENSGDVPLSNVQVIDDLTTVFNASEISSFSIVTGPTVTTTSDLQANASYDGDSDINLLTGVEKLDPGENATISFTVEVTYNTIDPATVPASEFGTFNNQGTASGSAPSGTVVTDDSDNGGIPDGNGDGDPTNDSDPTPVDFVPPLAGPNDFSVDKSVKVCGTTYTSVGACDTGGGLYTTVESADPGSYLIYKIVASNDSTSGIIDEVKILDEVLTPSEFVAATASTTGTTNGTLEVRCSTSATISGVGDASLTAGTCTSSASSVRHVMVIDTSDDPTTEPEAGQNGLELDVGETVTLLFVVYIP